MSDSDPLNLALSVNGILLDLEEDATGDTFAAANIKKCGAIAKALALLPPWTEVYAAGPFAGSGPLLSCFGKDFRTVCPPFAIAGESTLKVYFHCKHRAIQMVAIILVQGRVIARNADVLADSFAREALRFLGPPAFETSDFRIWRDSDRELYAKKGNDLAVRWAMRRGDRIAVPGMFVSCQDRVTIAAGHRAWRGGSRGRDG